MQKLLQTVVKDANVAIMLITRVDHKQDKRFFIIILAVPAWL